MSLTRRLALLERTLVDRATRDEERFFARAKAAIGHTRYDALLQSDPATFEVVMHEAIQTDPDLHAAWLAMDATAKARFLAIRCNAPPLPLDSEIVRLYVGTDHEADDSAAPGAP